MYEQKQKSKQKNLKTKEKKSTSNKKREINKNSELDISKRIEEATRQAKLEMSSHFKVQDPLVEEPEL